MLRGRVSPVRLGLSQLHRPSAEPPLLRVRCPSEAAQPRQVPGEASRRSPVFSTKFVPPTLHAGGGAVPGAESSAPAGPATLPRTQKRGSRVKGTGREHWNSKEVPHDPLRVPFPQPSCSLPSTRTQRESSAWNPVDGADSPCSGRFDAFNKDAFKPAESVGARLWWSSKTRQDLKR